MSAASNEFRRDIVNLLATVTNVHGLADVLMEVGGRLRGLRATVAESGSVHADEMLTRMARAESEIERIARTLSFNA
jgi:hypothetical protein